MGKMAGTKTLTEEDEWTEADLRRLLAAVKSSIPESDKKTAYHRGLKSVDWEEVAFSTFSPEACQEKFTRILQTIRKMRSLTELIVEAEDVISESVKKIKVREAHLSGNELPGAPETPSPPDAMFYEENRAKYQKKHPNLSQQRLLRHLTKKYQALPDEEKAQYVEKFKLAKEEYTRKMKEFCKQYEKPPSRRHKTNRKRKRLSGNASDGSEDEDDMPAKPPISGYHTFCQELGMSSVVSVKYWQALTETRRNEYNALCKELKRQYPVKLKNYLKTVDETKRKQILNEKSMKRFRNLKDIMANDVMMIPGKPKTPARSGKKKIRKKETILLEDKVQHPRQHLAKTLPAPEQEAYQKHNHSKQKFLGDKDISDGEDSCDAVDRPSDSEDEDIEDSSSDEEQNDSNCCEAEEEEEDDDAIMFDLY